MTIGAPPPGSLSGDALRYIRTIAERTHALVYDVQSLYAPNGEKLLDVDGFVSDDVPGDYPDLARTPAPPAVERWTDAPFVVVPELEPLIGAPPDVGRVLRESKADREEFVQRLLDLSDRIRAARVPPQAAERRARLLFELARANAIVEAPDVREVAARVHGWPVLERETRDEARRLVLSMAGNFDPRALSPRQLLIFSEAASGTGPKGLASHGFDVTALDDVLSSPDPLAKRVRAFMDSSLELRARASRRRARIVRRTRNTATVLKVWSKAPMGLDQIATVLRCLRSMRGVVFDGWGFYDHRGRALLVLSGDYDPSARFLRPA